jgi:predicted TPR repeat methyltransferase
MVEGVAEPCGMPSSGAPMRGAFVMRWPRAAPKRAAPSARPDSYVKSLFNRYAERFDDERGGRCSTATPQLMVGAVRRAHLAATAPAAHVDELGCGTGCAAC